MPVPQTNHRSAPHTFGDLTLPHAAMRVSSEKRKIVSQLYGREAHADIFRIGKDSDAFSMILFGGSGIDRAMYKRHSRTVPDLFDDTLTRLSQLGLRMTFVHVCAPYDVPFARFRDFLRAAPRWVEHVREELLPEFVRRPFAVAGYSGGILLGLNGLELSPMCVGGYAFGPDGLSADIKRPPHWRLPLRMYSGQRDRVSESRQNRGVMMALSRNGVAEKVTLTNTSHSLEEYARFSVLGTAILHAHKLFSDTTQDPQAPNPRPTSGSMRTASKKRPRPTSL